LAPSWELESNFAWTLVPAARLAEIEPNDHRRIALASRRRAIMNTDSFANSTRGSSHDFQWPAIVGWGIFAALAGLCCWVLPPYLIPGSIVNSAYGHPLMPWFEVAMANGSFATIATPLFVVGVVIGAGQPRFWPFSCSCTMSLVFLLHAINMAHDWTIDATSHNLWPFEVVGLAVWSLPALAGGGIGCLARRAIQHRRVNPRPTPASGPLSRMGH